MECRRFRSVVSKMDPLSAGRSHSLSSTALVPVSVKSLSFSISAILGLEDDIKHQNLNRSIDKVQNLGNERRRYVKSLAKIQVTAIVLN